MNINKTILMGRITADPELKQTTSGTSVVQFSVAVNRKYDRDKTDFIDCTAFNRNADFLNKYFRKGSSIIVFGNIQVDSYKDKDGNNRKSVRVIADEVQFGESKNKEQNNTAPEAPAATNADFFSDVKDDEPHFDDQLPF